MFKILNGYENIDSNIVFSKLSKVKQLEGTTSRWRRNKVDWTLDSFHFPRGPSMFGINYQQTVYMLVVLIIVFKNKIDKCLVKAGYT